MKANARRAFRVLEKAGWPVGVHEGEGHHFYISAESPNSINGKMAADYYAMGGRAKGFDDFGVRVEIQGVLERNGLFCEWQNPGSLNVYDV